MGRYFLITGMDEGCPIESYAVMTDGQQPSEVQQPCYGDCSRYAEEITKAEYLERNTVYLFYHSSLKDKGFYALSLDSCFYKSLDDAKRAYNDCVLEPMEVKAVLKYIDDLFSVEICKEERRESEDLE